ncbi:MAG: ATP-binding cassette domain-containing protein [Flavobacteriales bacterium]
MNLELNNIGKKYNKEWIFRGINLSLSENDRYVVLGSNGSGKSTFIKLIAGFNIPSEGDIQFSNIKSDNFYKQISIAAPYLDLYTDFTLKELATFHAELKPFRTGIDQKEFIKLIELAHATDKQLKHFSSGMLQRVKLGLAILSNTPILLLDEPTSNLDKKAIIWYNELLSQNIKNKIILIASNRQDEEYKVCDKALEIEKYKV